MRLDAFLKRVGLVKQRSLAKEICSQGRVTVDGRESKAGKEIGIGSVVGVELRDEHFEIEIVGLPARNYKRKEGEAFYRVIEHEEKDAY